MRLSTRSICTEPSYQALAAIGIANAASRIIALVSLGLLDWSTLAAGSMIGVIGIPSNWIADRILPRMGREIHSWIISGIIICAGLHFLILAALELLGSVQPLQVEINKLSAEAGQSVRSQTRQASRPA